MIKKAIHRLSCLVHRERLSKSARDERRKDRRGLSESDVGIDRAVDEALAWLGRAQDNSASADGGVARHYSLRSGWGNSYPETTGYIIPTLLDAARRPDGAMAEDLRERARRMLNWLISIQLPSGAFQGGMVGQLPVVPVTFNTGQILLGLAAGARDFGSVYRPAMIRAADWLVTTQDPDGCWRKYPTPFAAEGEKVYETHVAWGLLEAYSVEPDPRYLNSALANLRWALGWQHENGWFDRCCLDDPAAPLTHTIGYALRGVLEGYRSVGDQALLRAARKTADGAIHALRPDGFLPGRLNANWEGTVSWACLTGTAQIAYCLFVLYQETGERKYRSAGEAANRYVRRSMSVNGPPNIRGGVKGSFPVDGAYGAYEYLNWACKFFVDAQLLEQRILSR